LWSKTSLRKSLSTPNPLRTRLQEGKEVALKATTEDVAGVRIVSRGGPSLRLGPREADSTPSPPLSWLSATPFLLGVGSIGLKRRFIRVASTIRPVTNHKLGIL
jgi:hypothetical protein